ncbi:SDR family NAD(P)-dependent oxidoreductase [Enhydrobacter sp.]|jgi:NAD(P)-dependent dehydrogenase (short-subunit alcohol dehydrogenase family)|uniref:SDR family NAD(P)-dependent oxidoreductase n=1 Tax=Enhydrobacter sp. TaxID=1894999 RepID=UPI00260E95DA|nr:SDR family NAD(P)-dependent oxidoreductase [Enhydrobacter sp.]WIM12856.1 MAG: Oxidoreductase, short-chain dehydrogenase/reductase family [Enhydrobacter sp.]
MDFSNRTVVITGAAGNLGQALANGFAAADANLVLVDLDATRLKSAFGADSEKRALVPANLLKREEAQRVVDAARQRFRKVDVLCNIAGGFRMGEAVHETSDETWTFLFDLNVRTLLNTVRAAVPAMIEAGGGKVVNVGAAGALRGGATMGAYAAAKSVVIRLTESMSAELRDRNINVNCVLPTIIDTPENRAAMPDADPARWVAPADLASTIMFLASDAARAIHGAAVPVAGRS